MNTTYLIIGILLVVVAVLGMAFKKSKDKLETLEDAQERFQGIIDIEAEQKRVEKEISDSKKKFQKEQEDLVTDTKKEQDRIVSSAEDELAKIDKNKSNIIADTEKEKNKLIKEAGEKSVEIFRSAKQSETKIIKEAMEKKHKLESEKNKAEDALKKVKVEISSLEMKKDIVESEIFELCKMKKKKEKIEKDIDLVMEKYRNYEDQIEQLEVDYKYGEFENVFTDGETIDERLYGLYDLDDIDSADIKKKLDEIILREKKSVKDGRATIKGYFPVWAEEKDRNKIMKLLKRLVLRTFNSEVDAVMSKISHKNYEQAEKKIRKSFDDLQKLISPFGCRISIPYLKLKLAEARLRYDYDLRKHIEKEEQRAIKEQMREEERAQREFEKAKMEAQKEEERARKALEKAKDQLEKVHGEKHDKLMAQMEELRKRLQEAEDNNTRATSMAQMTKSGYVYVISNIGAFGENIYKIGMTRRLEPMDRVKELSSASVPFGFDVHAMIYTDNAPELENQLHKRFHDLRVNKINNRKEFFRVSLDDVKAAVEDLHGEFKLTKLAEARDYRETISLERELKAV